MNKDTPKKHTQSKKREPLPKHLEHINRWAAGIDVGSTSHFVAVPEGCDEKTVREFKSFSTGLNEMADWLKQCGIQTIAMESTGVYWIPVWGSLHIGTKFPAAPI